MMDDRLQLSCKNTIGVLISQQKSDRIGTVSAVKRDPRLHENIHSWGGGEEPFSDVIREVPR